MACGQFSFRSVSKEESFTFDTLGSAPYDDPHPVSTLRSSRPFRLLPLILLAIMLALGLLIEAGVYRTLLWETKIPLAALLAIAFLRRRERER
jgi:hypothetical protein